jgi:hypothetical protein
MIPFRKRNWCGYKGSAILTGTCTPLFGSKSTMEVEGVELAVELFLLRRALWS